MENYHKAETHKYSTAPEPHEIRIGQRHRIKEVVSKALRFLADEEMKKVLLSGQGASVTKTVTCCEIVKRKVPSAYQKTEICYATVEDIWEANDPALELEPLKVTTRTPAIHILVTHESLDTSSPGCQGPCAAPAAKRPKPSQPARGRKRPSRRSKSEGDRKSISEEAKDDVSSPRPDPASKEAGTTKKSRRRPSKK